MSKVFDTAGSQVPTPSERVSCESEATELQEDLESHGLMVDLVHELRGQLASLRTGDSSLRSFAGLPEMTYGFFPGGNGLYEGVDSELGFPGGVLVLGSNFGCISEFVDDQGKLMIDDERDNPTWKPLLHLLRDSGVPIEECFFTNAWPFLHEGEGNLPKDLTKKWLGNSILMASCLQFSRLTVAQMRPRLVILLGKGPAAFLSHLWPNELSQWRGYSLDCMDDLPKAVVTYEDHTAVCVAITHPSMPNAWRRRPPYQHRDGEIRLVTEALAQADATV